MEAGRLDGMGGGVRLTDPAFICSNGQGSLCIVVAGTDRIAHLKLPASWRAGAGDNGPNASGAAGGCEERARVTFPPCRAASEIWGLAYHPSAGPDGALIIATRTALYRLPLNPDGSPAARVPVLLAGLEGVEGTQDGRVEEARFTDLCGCAVDGEGNVIVADIAEVMEGDRLEDEEGEHMDYRTAVRRLALDGTVTTLVPRPGRGLGLKGTYGRPVILHTGHLCLTSSAESAIRVLGLGLKPCPLLCPASKARAPCGSLHADMGALLDAQPDGTADLTLVPLLPAAAGGFADGAAAELGLPEADPDAFALVLRWVYTGAVDIPSALAPAVAELADRLLLPELCSDAQAVVLSGVSAETVVGSLLWAERLGGSFAPLLSQLKAWCAERGEEVAAVPHSLKRLAKSPDLMATLMADLLAGGVKRRRTA